MFMQDISRTAIASSLVGPLPAPITTGLVAGTLVETAGGWVGVETLQIGAGVHTLDGGLARILGLDRRILHPEAETALVVIAGGGFDACSDLCLLPGQHLLFDVLNDTDLDGAAFALLPAAALCASQAVQRRPLTAPVEIITPLFADEEVVYANSGVLLHCPGIIDGAGRYPEASFFPRLTTAQGRGFLARRLARLAA